LAVAGAVDWSSKSVVELEAFLRSRGVVLDLGGEGQVDRVTLVEIAAAIADDVQEQQQQQQQQSRQRGDRVKRAVASSVWLA
jgi:Zn-finger nucleic acid-binding protein